MNLYLIRHAQSEGNVNSKKYMEPHHSIELTEVGIKQAKECGSRLCKYLEEKRINAEEIITYVSPWKRTLDTWKYINESLQIKNVYEDERLVEHLCDYSSYIRNKNIVTEFDQFLNERKNNDFHINHLLGESLHAVKLRAMNFINIELDLYCKNNQINNCIIVSHYELIQQLISLFRQQSYTDYKEVYDVKNTTIIKIEYESLKKKTMPRIIFSGYNNPMQT